MSEWPFDTVRGGPTTQCVEEKQMRRVLSTVLIAAISMTVVGAGIALAAEIEIIPASPDQGGSEFTIKVTDFAPDTPIYALPCEIPAAGAELDPSADSCDISRAATATTDADGSASIVVDWDVPEGGIAVYVGDETLQNEATQIVMPGDTQDEVVVEATEPDPDPEVEVLGTTVVQEDLADTGPREVVILTVLATALIGIGLGFRGFEQIQRRA